MTWTLRAAGAYTLGVSSLTPKTLARGLSKTRSKTPSIGVQTLIEKTDKTKLSAFTAHVLEKVAVSDDEALEAARMLSTPKHQRLRRYTEGAAIGSAAYPLSSAAGQAAKALAGHGPGKARAAQKAVSAAFSRPEVAKNVVQGAFGGGAVQAIREGVELGHAKRTVQSFLKEHSSRKED